MPPNPNPNPNHDDHQDPYQDDDEVHLTSLVSDDLPLLPDVTLVSNQDHLRHILRNHDHVRDYLQETDDDEQYNAEVMTKREFELKDEQVSTQVLSWSACYM